MTREEAIRELKIFNGTTRIRLPANFWEALNMAIKALEKEPKTGQWLRMSDLSEQKDDRYKCSRCGNVIHYKNKMDLYTFNSWCGRCGSDNGRKIEVKL